MSAELFAKGFEDAVDKGYDFIPNQAFLTPAERKQRKRQRQAELAQQQQQQQQDPQAQQQPDSRQAPDQRDSRSSRDDRSGRRHHDHSYDHYSQDSRQSVDIGRRDQQLDRIASPAMTDNYYQPPGSDYRRGYNPQDYQPRDDRYARDPYARPASVGATRSRYDSRASYDDDGYSSSDRERRSHRKSHSRKKSRSRSRSGVRGKLDKNFDKSNRGLTSGAIGAIAGGLVGNEVGKGIVPTLAGVVLGGLGANAYEARDRNKSRDERSSRDTKDSHLRRARSAAGHGEGRRASGRREDSYDDDYYRYEDSRGGSSRYGGRDSYGGGYDRGLVEDQSSAGYGGNARAGESRRERRGREEMEGEEEKQRGQGGKGVFS